MFDIFFQMKISDCRTSLVSEMAKLYDDISYLQTMTILVHFIYVTSHLQVYWQILFYISLKYQILEGQVPTL